MRGVYEIRLAAAFGGFITTQGESGTTKRWGGSQTIRLCQSRKADAAADRKLLELRNSKVVITWEQAERRKALR